MIEDLPLTEPTSSEWSGVALSDLDALLNDHAHCELKAASTAMGLAGRSVSRSSLVRDMTVLAHEEIRHFERVHALVLQRGGVLRPVERDPYVVQLRREVLGSMKGFPKIIDQLILCAFIEARSCERFRILAKADLPDELSGFYRELAVAEAKHHELFLRHAEAIGGEESVFPRVEEIAEVESSIVRRLPLAPRIH
jgi:tRNA-(ms[2]io[6]A)-hydroxylase